MNDRASGLLLAAAVLGVAVWGVVEALRPESGLNRALLLAVVLVVVSLITYRVRARRGGGG